MPGGADPHPGRPNVEISQWEFYDLSCKARDDTEDQVLHDAVAAGKRIKAIFKEPTITPTEVQKEELGLKKAWGSPNGAMRRGWNGITISRQDFSSPGFTENLICAKNIAYIEIRSTLTASNWATTILCYLSGRLLVASIVPVRLCVLPKSK